MARTKRVGGYYSKFDNEDSDRSMDLNGLIRFLLGFFPNPEQRMLDHGDVVPPERKLQRSTQIVNLPKFDPERREQFRNHYGKIGHTQTENKNIQASRFPAKR
ncbi:hypothetical protein PYW08_013021 [Mythimna loreyi]|uniref:Uncharacterized protein n=1 Tax=Mythimna loreyi TaxID=667449 RepID=A0ACC2Q037_9NEOP|nr:hypothetical protein PYW08_013021 [Mythimna loreyi]